MGRYGDLDYVFLARAGFLLGLGLLAIGVGGEFIGHAYFKPLPPWENALFFDLEVIGLLVGFFPHCSLELFSHSPSNSVLPCHQIY